MKNTWRRPRSRVYYSTVCKSSNRQSTNSSWTRTYELAAMQQGEREASHLYMCTPSGGTLRLTALRTRDSRTMNLPHRPPLHLSELTSVLNIWLRKHHRKRGKAKGPTGANMEVESDPAPGGKALPLTPAEQQEAAARMDELQRQLAREQETREKQNAEYEAVVAENDQLKTRLTQLDSLPHQVKDLQKKREHEQETAHKGWELYEGAAAEAQQLKARVAQLEEEVKQSEMRVSELEQAHAHSERERRTSIDLLETRTNELRAAQVFLKNDEITDDEIMHLVDTLNAQVAKTAAAIAPASQFRFESVKDAASMEKAVRRIEHYSWLSPHLLSLLRTTDHTRSTTLVQTALQAGMIMYARWLATSWELGVIDPRGLLEGLYFQMRERGTHPNVLFIARTDFLQSHNPLLVDGGP